MIDDKLSLFLDSGAFSAFTKNVDINIDEYIEFIKKYEQHLDVYANLDVIKNAEATMVNQRYMESKGLHPLPVYHLGSDHSYLEHYSENYEYIGLGGMAGIDTPKPTIIAQLDELWMKYLANEDGTARVKVHGFACTGTELVKRYPWYSVDSTSWVLNGRFGSVFCPIGDLNKITISDQSDTSKPDHFKRFPEHDKQAIIEYFKNLGRGYTIEELEEKYQSRDEVNILYFINLEKQLVDNPPLFKIQQMHLF